MIVTVTNSIRHYVAGPADLARFGRGDKLIIRGDISDYERSHWSIAIGLFVMRGGAV